MEAGVKTQLLGRIDVAEKRLAHIPCIVSNNKRMAIWSDIKEVLFLWCASQKCCAVLNALKHQLGYPACELAMHPCTQLEQLMFLKLFVVVTPGTLLVDLSRINNTSALMLMYDVVKMKHNHSKDPTLKLCNEIMARITENFSNSSIKIPLANLVRKKFIPAVRRTCTHAASKATSGWALPSNMSVTITQKHSKNTSQSDREESGCQESEDTQLQTDSPVISSVVYSAGDREASEALVPLSVLLAMFPACQGYLEYVVQQFVLGRCDQEYLRSVRKCLFEEGIQLTRFIASQQGYEIPWVCVTSCSVLISWAEFWAGYTKSKDAVRLLQRSCDISVVTLDCQGLVNAVPALSPTIQQPRGAKSLTFVETISDGKPQYKIQGALVHKPSETISADGYKLAESQVQSRNDLKTSQQHSKLKAEQHNYKRTKLRDEKHVGEWTGANNGNYKSSSKNLDQSKKQEKQKNKVKTGKVKKQSKERKSKNTSKIKGTSRTYVRVTRSSVNMCIAETNPHTDLEEQEEDKHCLQTDRTNLGEAKSKKYKKDSNNSAVLDDVNNSKEESGGAQGKKTLEINCNQAGVGAVKNDTGNKDTEQGKYSNSSSNESKDCGDHQNNDAIKDDDMKDFKQEDVEKMEDGSTETETYSMAAIEVSITPKKNKQSETSQTEDSKAQSLLQLTALGKKKGGYSVNIPERTVLKISPAKINDNLPIKLRLKKEYSRSSRSYSASWRQENSTISYTDGGNGSTEGNCNNKPGCVDGAFSPKYVSIISKQYQLKTPTVSPTKKLTLSEKFPYKSVRSQPESGQKEAKADKQPNTSPKKYPLIEFDKTYPVIQGNPAYETLKSSTTAAVSLPGPLNPIISNPLPPTQNLPDAIVKNLQEQASKSICSILGNHDVKMLETIQAEGKVIPVKYTDNNQTDRMNRSNFQTDRVNMWKRSTNSPEKGTGRLSKSADVHKQGRTYTYRPSSSIYSYTHANFERNSGGPSFQNALSAIYSRDKPESPKRNDVKCEKEIAPVVQAKPTEEKKAGGENKIKYGSSSSKTPDIYDKFARKRNKPRGTIKSDVSPIKGKTVGQTVPKPVPTSKPQVSSLNQDQLVKEKGLQQVGDPKTAGQTPIPSQSTRNQKQDHLPQSGEPFQQRYSHMVNTSLANLPYISMMNSSSPSFKTLPTDYPSCSMCIQAQEVNSDWRNFNQCVPPDWSNESICQSSTESRMETEDSQCSFNDTSSKESVSQFEHISSSTEEAAKSLSLLEKVDTFVDNYVSPRSSQSLEDVENLAAFMNFNFLSDEVRQNKGFECILEACQNSSYPFRHCKECPAGSMHTAIPGDTVDVLADSRETIARVNSQLYFSNPGSSQLFKVSGDVTIPANAQFYIQTNLGECKQAFPNMEYMPGIDGSAQAPGSTLKETCNLDKNVETSTESISDIFGEDTYKPVAYRIENPFEIVESNEMICNIEDIANQNESEGISSEENEVQDETLTQQDIVVDTDEVDRANVEQPETAVGNTDTVDQSPTAVSANSSEHCRTRSEVIAQTEQKTDTLNDSDKQTMQDSSNKVSCSDMLKCKVTVESYRNKTTSPHKINSKSPKPDRNFAEYVKQTRATRKREEEALRKKKFWASAQVQNLKRCQGSTYRPSRAIKPEPKTSSKPLYKTLVEKPIEGSNKVKSTSAVKDSYARPRTASGLRNKQNIQQKARPKTVPRDRSEDQIAEDTVGSHKILPIKNDTLAKERSGKKNNSKFGIGKVTSRPKTSPLMKVDRKTVPSRTIKSAKLKTEMPKSFREKEKKTSTDAYQVASTLRRLSLENNFGMSDKKYEARRNKLHSFVRAEFDKVKTHEVDKSSSTEMSHVDTEMYNQREEQYGSISEPSLLGDKLLPVETSDQTEGETQKTKRETFITQFNPRYIMDKSYTSYDLYNKIITNDTRNLKNQTKTGIKCNSKEYLNSNENNKISPEDVLTTDVSHPEVTENSSACGSLSEMGEVLHDTNSSHHYEAAFTNSLPEFCGEKITGGDELAQSCNTMPVLEKESTHNTVTHTEETVQNDNIGATISIDTSRSNGEDICLKLTCLDNQEYIIPSNHPSYISLMTFFQEQQLGCLILTDQEHTHTQSREQNNINSTPYDTLDNETGNVLKANDENVTDMTSPEDDVVLTSEAYETRAGLQETITVDGTDGAQYTYVMNAFEPESAALLTQNYSSSEEPLGTEEQIHGYSVFEGDVDDSVAEISDDHTLGMSDSDGASMGTQSDEECVYEWSCHNEDTPPDYNPHYDDEPSSETEETVVLSGQTLGTSAGHYEQSMDNANEITVYTESGEDEDNDDDTLKADELGDYTLQAAASDVDVSFDKYPEEQEYKTDNGSRMFLTTEDPSMTNFYSDQEMKVARYLNVDINTSEIATLDLNSRKCTKQTSHSDCRSHTDINEELTSAIDVGDELSLGAEAEIIESTDSTSMVSLGDKNMYGGKLISLNNDSEFRLFKGCIAMDFNSDDGNDIEVDVDDIKDKDYIPEDSDEEDLGDIYDDVMKINKSLGKAENNKKYRGYSKISNLISSSKKMHKKYIDKGSARKIKLKTPGRESRKSDTDSEDGFSSESGSTPMFGSLRYERAQYRREKYTCFDESDSDYYETDSQHSIETKHPKSKHRKNISRSRRKNVRDCEGEVEDKVKEKEAAKATEGFIKTQQIYFDIIKNSPHTSSSCDMDINSSRGVEGIDAVPSGIPVHGDRVITKAEAVAEKALEGTGSLSDDSEAPQVIEDLANNCRYQLVEDEDHINLGGIAYFGDFALPFVYINGYKYTPLKDALSLFQPGHCVSKCTIPRNVLQKHKQTVKTFSTWDHVYKFELIKMKKGPAIKTGDMVVKLDSLFNTLPDLVREIVRLHKNTKLKRSQDCDMTSYRHFKTSAVT